MKLYIVNSGEYSDWRIICIFSSMEKAKHFMDSYPGEAFNDVEEWEMNELVGRIGWCVEMDGDGNAEAHRTPEKIQDYPHCYGPPHLRFQNKWSMFMHAEDEKHAIKIANERRLKRLANGTWIATRDRQEK